MELVPGGFASNPVSVITYVDATTITVMDARTVEAESAGRQLNVGLPANRGWEGFVLEEDDSLWSLGEEYIPGPVQQVTLGPGGQLHNVPIYILKLYAPLGFGSTALYKVADAVLAAFPPRYAMTLADGTVLRVRSGEGPYRSEALPTNEELMVNVYIPLWARTINSI